MVFGLGSFAGALGGLAQSSISEGHDPMDVFGMQRLKQAQLQDSGYNAFMAQCKIAELSNKYREIKRKDNMTIKEILQEETDEWLKDALK